MDALERTGCAQGRNRVRSLVPACSGPGIRCGTDLPSLRVPLGQGRLQGCGRSCSLVPHGRRARISRWTVLSRLNVHGRRGGLGGLFRSTSLAASRQQTKATLRAQYYLGHHCYYGRGVYSDTTEAVRWYRVAADHGDVGSQVRLGYLHYHGRGVPKDAAEAVRWYRLAAD